MLPTKKIWYYTVHGRSCQEEKVVRAMNLDSPEAQAQALLVLSLLGFKNLQARKNRIFHLV